MFNTVYNLWKSFIKTKGNQFEKFDVKDIASGLIKNYKQRGINENFVDFCKSEIKRMYIIDIEYFFEFFDEKTLENYQLTGVEDYFDEVDRLEELTIYTGLNVYAVSDNEMVVTN